MSNEIPEFNDGRSRRSQSAALANLMEYQGIRYTIRAGIERGQYRAVIHPDGGELPSKTVFGSREDAEVYARRMINRWLAAKSGQNPEAPDATF